MQEVMERSKHEYDQNPIHQILKKLIKMYKNKNFSENKFFLSLGSYAALTMKNIYISVMHSTLEKENICDFKGSLGNFDMRKISHALFVPQFDYTCLLIIYSSKLL